MSFDMERYQLNLPTRRYSAPDHAYEGKYQSRTAREIAQIHNDSQIEGERIAKQAELDWFESEIYKAETVKLVDDADDLIDYARGKAKGDRMKEVVFGNIVFDWQRGASTHMQRRHLGGL